MHRGGPYERMACESEARCRRTPRRRRRSPHPSDRALARGPTGSRARRGSAVFTVAQTNPLVRDHEGSLRRLGEDAAVRPVACCANCSAPRLLYSSSARGASVTVPVTPDCCSAAPAASERRDAALHVVASAPVHAAVFQTRVERRDRHPFGSDRVDVAAEHERWPRARPIVPTTLGRPGAQPLPGSPSLPALPATRGCRMRSWPHRPARRAPDWDSPRGSERGRGGAQPPRRERERPASSVDLPGRRRHALRLDPWNEKMLAHLPVLPRDGRPPSPRAILR